MTSALATLNRKQLQELFQNNPIAVKAFENLFDLLKATSGSNAFADALTNADTAGEKAVEAFALVAELVKNLTGTYFRPNIDLPTIDAYAPPRPDALNIDISQPPIALGSLAQQNAENLVLKPRALMSPPLNGDLVFEATANTTVTIRMRGADGVSRSIALTIT
jgi:hypothetical protein